MFLRNLLVQHLGLAPSTASIAGIVGIATTMKHDETGMSDTTATVFISLSGHFKLIFFALKVCGIDLPHLQFIFTFPLCILKPEETKEPFHRQDLWSPYAYQLAMMKRQLPADGIPALLAIIPEPRQRTLAGTYPLTLSLGVSKFARRCSECSLLFISKDLPSQRNHLSTDPMSYSCNTSTLWGSQAARPNRPKAPSTGTHADTPAVSIRPTPGRSGRGVATCVAGGENNSPCWTSELDMVAKRSAFGWLASNVRKFLLFQHCCKSSFNAIGQLGKKTLNYCWFHVNKSKK